MKEYKKRLLRKINLSLGSLIAALGVTGCAHQKVAVSTGGDDQRLPSDENQIETAQQDDVIMCLYGVPRAEYVVEGVLLDEAGKPIREKAVAASTGSDAFVFETDQEGHFMFDFMGFPATEMTFEVDGVKYTEPIEFDNESAHGMYTGRAVMQIRLVHKVKPQVRKDSVSRPIMVKYGLPPIRFNE